jgi:hypothetical protein
MKTIHLISGVITVHLVLVVSVLSLLLTTNAGAVTPASIEILSPADHSVLDADESYPLAYEVIPGTGSDHFHVWVDKDRSKGIHETKGTYTLPKLSPGKHTITIKLVDKDHVPTGPEKSIQVIAK